MKTKWTALLLIVAAVTCRDNAGPPPTPLPMSADVGPYLSAYAGNPAAMTFRLTDSAGTAHAPWSYLISWGDGHTDSGTSDSLGRIVTANHSYNGTGIFTVRLTATNRAGASASDSTTAMIDAPGTPEIMIGAGDIAECDTMTPLYVQKTGVILAGTSGTIFTLGDNAYPDGSPAAFQTCYDPYWGPLKRRTHPVAGNHDYNTPGAAGYFGYFGVAAGDPTKGWYSYDVGAWHVVVLNANYIESQVLGQQLPLDSQLTWLRADLAAHPAKCTLAMWHQPRFSSDQDHPTQPLLQPFWQVLYDNNADLILNGHAHNYERFAPQTPDGTLDSVRGIREIIAGTGGGGYSPVDTPPQGNVQITSIAHGLLKLTLSPTAYHWDFVPIPGFTFTDSGTTACH